MNARIIAFVGAELVATLAAAATAAQQGASVERQVALAVSVAGLLGVFWAVATYVLKPLFDRWLKGRLEADHKWFDGMAFDALDRNDKNRDIERRRIERLFADMIAAIVSSRDQVEQNKDDIAFVKEAVQRQGEALTKEMAVAVRDFTRSNEFTAQQNREQTAALREIQLEIKRISEAQVRMEERFNAQYDGPERRGKPR